jgi:acyl-homoserine lactone acylase PvdQ
VPGLDPLALALTGKTFVPSDQAEAFLANQIDAVRSQRTVGPKILALINAYAAGVNGYYRAKSIPATPFTANDVIASAALIAARFGTNGGQEAQNSMFLDALADRLGAPTHGASSPTCGRRTTRNQP